MRKATRIIVFTASTFGISVLLIYLLFVMSSKANHSPNGFIRLFPPHVATNPKLLLLPNLGYSISGATSNSVYLTSNHPRPHLLKLSNTLTDSSSKDIISNIPLAWRAMTVAIDSPDIYLMEGYTPTIIQSSLISKQERKKPIKPYGFSKGIPISPNSFVVRVYDNKRKQNILVKLSSDSALQIKSNGILEKQIDGLFCTDGMLLHNKIAQREIYIYGYRNEFICMDSNLNIIYKGRTVDTTHWAKIHADTIKSEQSITLSKPPVSVNLKACMNDKWLFVNSALRANNESKVLFSSHNVIDVYSLDNGVYKCSFYAPKYGDNRISDMLVYGNRMFVLYPNRIISFNIMIQ